MSDGTENEGGGGDERTESGDRRSRKAETESESDPNATNTESDPSATNTESDPSAGGRSTGRFAEASRVVRGFVRSIPGPAIVCDPRTLAVRAVNEPAATLLGQDPGTLTLMGVTDLGDATDAVSDTPVEELLTSPSVDGDRTRFEWIVDGGDGQRRVEVTARTTTLNGTDHLVVGLTDVTDRVRTEQRRLLDRRVVDAIATTVPAALFQCDESGTLTRWNRRLEEDSGYASDELSGLTVAELVVDGESGPLSEELARVYRSGDTVSSDVTLLTRSGEQVPYRVTIGPVVGDDGTVIGAIGIGEDLTESTLREERLAVLTRVLRHNFRNDLNVIAGFTEQAIADIDDPATVDRLERVVATAGRLLRVGETSRKVEKLLDDHHTPVELSLSAAVAEAVDSLPDELLADAAVTVDVADDVTVEAVERFPEAVAELVDNAIRHNDAPSPTVTVRAAAHPSESWVSLVVADNGSGIPPVERAVLAGEETQLDHASGLGLWYVNWLVSAASGSVDISESGAGGARVELTLRRTDLTGGPE